MADRRLAYSLFELHHIEVRKLGHVDGRLVIDECVLVEAFAVIDHVLFLVLQNVHFSALLNLFLVLLAFP